MTGVQTCALPISTRPDGSVETRDYYDNGKLKQLKDVDANNHIISRYDYIYDKAGNIINDNNSNEAGPYTFDSAVQTYDVDNRLGTYNGQTVTYDADGNMIRGPLAGDMENFTFDARSRLTGAGNTSYTYDAGNKRISVSHGTHQTSYVVNPNAYLSQVLIATDESDHKTYYVYGLGLIGQEAPDGSYRSYHFDHLGSTIALTSESGSVTDRFQYAPYGELIYRSGNTTTPFLFNGQYGVMTDESDLYYMRARYYNPIAKRFLSPDTLVGQISNPQSQNRYVYCEGNPANYVDPTGYKYLNMSITYNKFKEASYGELYNEYTTLESIMNNQICIIFGEGYGYWDVFVAEDNFYYYSDQFSIINELLIINNPNPWVSDDEREFAQITLDNLLSEEGEEDSAIALGLTGGIGKVGAKTVKGKTFRGGSKNIRDIWYGFKDKDFQRWWHRKGKAEWGNTDITTRQMAEEVYRAWVESGKPKVK